MPRSGCVTSVTLTTCRRSSRESPGRAAAARTSAVLRAASATTSASGAERAGDDQRRPPRSRPRRSRASSPPACRCGTPDATVGGRSSNGTVLRLTVISHLVEPLLRVLARPVRAPEVDLEQVRVGAAREDIEAVCLERLRERVGVRADLRPGSRGTARRRRSGSRSPWPRWRARAARPASRGRRRGRPPAACSSRQRTKPDRGPASVLCVVEVTKSQCGTGFGWSPAATRPAKCAMSQRRKAPTSSAISRNRSASTVRG